MSSEQLGFNFFLDIDQVYFGGFIECKDEDMVMVLMRITWPVKTNVKTLVLVKGIWDRLHDSPPTWELEF